MCVLLCWVWALACKYFVLTWHFVSIMARWLEKTLKTQLDASVGSPFTLIHMAHMLVGVYYRGSIYGPCPHADFSRSLVITHPSQCTLPALNAVAIIVSEITCCRINTQSLWWHRHDKWLKQHFCVKGGMIRLLEAKHLTILIISICSDHKTHFKV